ncbi:uncharacterized protein LOC129317185 isoform X2 [Prosopis cineraria]|uniref:uncharacterized protein LOC129317185 isoform X2 n=1 Tax=Prosopis cineraria TaxID=364024 RepID=UPI00240FE149|nr:uncharacterized protein LOC129317185 isoform X2 [Prosopis cineraria]
MMAICWSDTCNTTVHWRTLARISRRQDVTSCLDIASQAAITHVELSAYHVTSACDVHLGILSILTHLGGDPQYNYFLALKDLIDRENTNLFEEKGSRQTGCIFKL